MKQVSDLQSKLTKAKETVQSLKKDNENHVKHRKRLMRELADEKAANTAAHAKYKKTVDDVMAEL